MLLKNKKIVVMGLLDTKSIAWAIGQRATESGAEVIYTVQNERFRDVLLRRAFKKANLNVDDYQIYPCDVTQYSEIEALFDRIEAPIHGLVHSIAYANPKTCMTNDMFSFEQSDIVQSYEISSASLAYVMKVARHKFDKSGGGVVALSFNTQASFPGYDWMGIHKTALEGTCRYLARDLGKQSIRMNCISAGPLATKAAGSIPGFQSIRDAWSQSAPLHWNPDEDHGAVADSALFLLSPLSRKTTGHVLYVDGGFHATRGGIG